MILSIILFWTTLSHRMFEISHILGLCGLFIGCTGAFSNKRQAGSKLTYTFYCLTIVCAISAVAAQSIMG